LQTGRSCQSALTTNSVVPVPQPQKLNGQDRLTEVVHGVEQRVCPFNVLLMLLTDATHERSNTLAIDSEFLSCSVDAGFVLALPWGP